MMPRKYHHLEPKIEFLEKDFDTLAKQLTEKYSPSGLSSLANIGTVLMTMMWLEELEKKEKHKAEKHEKDSPEDDMFVDIQDELDGAKKYYQCWLDTKDLSYKQMAKDEMRHMDFFIKRARMNVADKERLQSYVEEYNKLLELIKQA